MNKIKEILKWTGLVLLTTMVLLIMLWLIFLSGICFNPSGTPC